MNERRQNLVSIWYVGSGKDSGLQDLDLEIRCRRLLTMIDYDIMINDKLNSIA